MPTIEDVLAYLGIDYADEIVTKNVQSALNTAKQVLLGSVGADVEKYLTAARRDDIEGVTRIEHRFHLAVAGGV